VLSELMLATNLIFCNLFIYNQIGLFDTLNHFINKFALLITLCNNDLSFHFISTKTLVDV